MNLRKRKLLSLTIAFALFLEMLPLGMNAIPTAAAAKNDISNASLSAKIGELGQTD